MSFLFCNSLFTGFEGITDLLVILEIEIWVFRKRLFADTLSVNKNIFADSLSANKKSFADAQSANKKLFADTQSAKKGYFQ